MPEKNKARTLRLPDIRRLPLRMACIWWIHLKRITARVGRTQSRIILLWHHQSIIVSGAALNRGEKKTAIPAPETTILRTTPKTKKTPSRQPPNRTIGKMGKLALMNRL